jgi:two-component system nitrate/nitrite response regulator NarL
VVAKELTGILARVVQGGHEDRRAPVAFSDLTPREREILCQLAEGRSNKGIARILGITDGTVKLHVKAILRKLAVHSRVEAAVNRGREGSVRTMTGEACAPQVVVFTRWAALAGLICGAMTT